MGCGASLQQQEDLYFNVEDDNAGDNNKVKETLLTEQETRKVNKELMKSLGLRYASFDVNALGENREHAVFDAIFSFEKQSLLYKMQIPVVDKLTHVERENNACDHVEKEEQQQQLEQIPSREHAMNWISENQEERIMNENCQNEINSMSISKNNANIIRDNAIVLSNIKERKEIDYGTDQTNKLKSDSTTESASINTVTKNRWWLLNDSKYTFVLYMTIIKAKNFKLLKFNDCSNDSNKNIEVEYVSNNTTHSLHDNVLQNENTNNNYNNNNNYSIQDKDKEADNTSSNKMTKSKENINSENNNDKSNSANQTEALKSNDTYQNIKIVATIPPRQLLPFFEGSFDAYMWACKVRKNAKQDRLLMAKPVNHFFVDED